MAGALDNRTVAITEHRFENELTTLIQRHGARVVSCPLLEERPVENRSELQAFLRNLIGNGFDFVVFFTGVGARFIAEEASAMDQSNQYREALKGMKVVVRGTKPRSAMRKLGLAVDLAPEKATSEGLLEMFAREEIDGKRIGVQLYGNPNPDFIVGLEKLGAEVAVVQVYNYGPASDRERVVGFIDTLLAGEVDAITFTSAPQVESLFGTADTSGRAGQLSATLNERICVAAVGEVTARALARHQISVPVVPVAPRMGPLADAIASYFEERDR